MKTEYKKGNVVVGSMGAKRLVLSCRDELLEDYIEPMEDFPDKIISLFKDTLLKEINNYDMHYEARDVIKNIIKNL